MGEDIGRLAAMRADERAHVLDQAKHRHIDLAEHVQPFARVDQREVLRGRHDHRAGQRHLLCHGELGIACAGRHVDDQDIELAPGDVFQHLAQGRHHHRSAPDHRRLLVDEKAHRHDFQPIGFHRLQLVVDQGLRLAFQAEQARHRGAVNIGVQNADGLAELLQAERQIDGSGGFADAALARGDRDDLGDARNSHATGGACARPRRLRLGRRRRLRPARTVRARSIAACRTGRLVGGQCHDGIGDARQRLHGMLGIDAQALQRAGPRRIDRKGEIDLAVMDDDLGDDALADDIALAVWTADDFQRFKHALLADRSGAMICGRVVGWLVHGPYLIAIGPFVTCFARRG